MNKNQYDTDVTTFSPQGRLFQLEYAGEAVNQGSASVGLVSDTHAVVAGVKRSPFELAAHQPKLFRVDGHMGIAVSGLTSDGRALHRHLRSEALNHRYVFGSEAPPSRLVDDLSDKQQECTQSYVRRPYGAGLLIAAWDGEAPVVPTADWPKNISLGGSGGEEEEEKPTDGAEAAKAAKAAADEIKAAPRGRARLWETSPAGFALEYHATAIGARSQAARTYLERHVEGFKGCGGDELAVHALRALMGCVEGGAELTADNATLSIVGAGSPWKLYDGADVAPLLEVARAAQEEEAKIRAASRGGAAAGGAADMEE